MKDDGIDLSKEIRYFLLPKKCEVCGKLIYSSSVEEYPYIIEDGNNFLKGCKECYNKYKLNGGQL